VEERARSSFLGILGPYSHIWKQKKEMKYQNVIPSAQLSQEIQQWAGTHQWCLSKNCHGQYTEMSLSGSKGHPSALGHEI